MITETDRPQVGDYMKFIWPEQDRHGNWHDVLVEGTVTDIWHEGNQFVVDGQKFEWIAYLQKGTLVAPDAIIVPEILLELLGW